MATLIEKSLKKPLSPEAVLDKLKAVNHSASLNDSISLATGHFQLSKTLLLDNRVRDNKAGYELLAVLTLSNAYPLEGIRPNLLVNLGWMPHYQNQRTPYPRLTLPDESVSLKGKVYIPPKGMFRLPSSEPRATQTHWLVQTLELSQISQILDLPLQPYMLRVMHSTPDRPWKISIDDQPINRDLIKQSWVPEQQVGISADKHLGYALQWWCFCLILMGIYFYNSLKIR